MEIKLKSRIWDAIMASFCHPLGIDFLYLFNVNFGMPFWTPLFRFLAETGRQRGSKSYTPFWYFGTQGHPKNASTTQPIFIDFASILVPFFWDLWLFGVLFSMLFWLVRRFRRFKMPSHWYWFAGLLQGCGGQRSAFTMTLGSSQTSFFRLFRKRTKVWNIARV